MYHIIYVMTNAVSLTTLSVQLRMYATCNKIYGKMCSFKHCSKKQ